MMERKFLAFILLISVAISSIVIIDLREYHEVELDYSLDVAVVNDTVLIIHQDFHRLYSGIAITEQRQGSVSIYRVAEGNSDLLLPRIAVEGDYVLVSWLVVNDSVTGLGYGHYDMENHSITNLTYVNLGEKITDYAISSQELVAASTNPSGITLYTVNITTASVASTHLDNVPDSGLLAISDGSVYFPENGRIMMYNGTLTEIATARGPVTAITGSDGWGAWAEETEGKQWGLVSISHENMTASLPVDREPKDLDLLVSDGLLYLTWTEYSPDTMNDDWSDEVKVAIVRNLSAPTLEFLNYASYRDNKMSWAPEFVDVSGDVRIYWFDRSGGYSTYWTTVGLENTGYPTVAYSNGETSKGTFILLAMGLTMGPMMAFMFMVTPRNRGTKEASRQRWFRTYVRKESYMFLKFYFTIVPFLFVAMFFMDMLWGPGASIGFRMGYDNVLKCAISIIAASVALYGLRNEASVSMFHEIGYLTLAGGLVAGLLGFGWYEFTKTAFNPWTLQVVYACGFVSSALVLTGPLLVLMGVTRKKAYAIMIIPLAAILAMAFLSLERYSKVEFLPSLGSVHRSLGIDTTMMSLLGMMFVGMVLAMHLFDMLTMERIKPLDSWTRRDVHLVRNRAVTVSALAMLAVTGMSASIFISMPNWGISAKNLSLFLDNPTLLMFMPVLIFMLAILILPNFKEENLASKFKDSPSKAVYSLYMNLPMLGIIVLMVGLMIGVLSLLLVGVYIYGIRKADALLDGVCESGLKEAAAEEMRIEDDRFTIVARANFAPIIEKNLKFMLMAPPFMAMITLLAWKSGMRFPFMVDVPGSYFPLVHLVSLAAMGACFFEIGLAVSSIRKAENLVDLLGWSSTKFGVVLSVLVMFFYAVTVSDVYVIVIQATIFQTFVLAYYLRVYPVMLDRINSASKEFFKMPEEVVPILMATMLKAKDDFDIPDPEDIATESVPAEGGGSAQWAVGGTGTPDADPAGLRVAQERGKLVGTERSQELVARKKNMHNQMKVLLLMGAVTLVMGLVMLVFLPFVLMFGLAFILLGVLLLALYPVALKSISKIEPMSVYEKGIEITRNDGSRIFLPFGGFLNCNTQKYRGKDLLVLTGSGTIQKIFIWDEISEFASTIPNLVGKDPGKMPDAVAYGPGDIKRTTKYILPLSLVMGALFAFMMLITFDDYDMLASFLYLLPPLTMLMFTYMVYAYGKMAKKAKTFMALPKSTPFLMAVICLTLLVIAGAMFPQGSLLQPQVGEMELVRDNAGALTSSEILNRSETGLVMNMDTWLLVDGDIVVRDSTFNFNCQWNGELGMLVVQDATPTFINCTFSAPSRDTGFKMELHGETHMVNCTVLNVYGDPDRENGDGGLEVYADSEFRNVTVQGGQTNGILVGECTLVISDSTIMDTGDDGIEIVRGAVEMNSTNLTNCYWGLMLQQDAWVNATGLMLNRCSYALTITDGCHVTIRDSIIKDSQRRAIRVGNFGTLEMENVVLENNARDYYPARTDLTDALRIFSVAGTVVGLAAALMLLRKQDNADAGGSWPPTYGTQ